MLGHLTKYHFKKHSDMDYKKTLGQVAIVIVGVLAAGYVKTLLDRSMTTAPSEV